MPSLILAAAAAVLLSWPLSAAIWPEQWREHKRASFEPAAVEETALWNEFLGEAAESALYKGPIGPFKATAWRLADATSALAWYQNVRPANCTPARDTIVLCTTPGGQYMAHMNYVFRFEGWRPLPKELEVLYPSLPALRSGGGIPKLPFLMPEAGRVRNSERYILGIQSLAAYEPSISPAQVGFEDSAEAQYARFNTPGGEVALTLFYYPNPQLARKYLPNFERQSGFAVKRSGPMIAVIPGGHSPEKIAKILDSVTWNVNFIWNEATKPPPMPDVAGMLIAIFELTGFLLLVCVGGGAAFAMLWIFLRRRQSRIEGTESAMTFLRISGR